MSTRRTIVLTAALFTFMVTTGQSIKRQTRLRLRAVLHRLLRSRSRPWPARTPGEVTLVFAPHPDDAELGCAGLIANRRESRESVHIACITDGAASHPGHPTVKPADLAEMRREESRLAASVLGVSPAHLHFLNAPDGRLPHLEATARHTLVATMAALIKNLRPTEIMVTSPFDGSTEHTAAHALVTEAIAAVGDAVVPRPALLEYFVWARWSPQRLWAVARSGGQGRIHVVDFPLMADRKQRAIAAHRSQTEPLAPQTASALSEDFVRAFKAPEEFYLRR